MENKETRGVRARKRRQSRQQNERGGFWNEALEEMKEVKSRRTYSLRSALLHPSEGAGRRGVGTGTRVT